jgi:hypothetical protein
MWIAVREASRLKRVAEYVPNGRRVAPPLASYTNGSKLAVHIERHLRCRKQRIVETPKARALEVAEPVLDDGEGIPTYWNKKGWEGLLNT